MTLLQKHVGNVESKLVEALLHGHHTVTANALMQISEVADKVFGLILLQLELEVRVLYQKVPPSWFRSIAASEIEKFQWEALTKELELKSPMLLKVLTAVVTRNDRRCSQKPPSIHFPAINTAVAVLLKERNREMCGVQSIISCLMYASHCEKQVHFEWVCT